MPLIDDRYELVEVIASGGMATVWRARDTRLERAVAVKRAHPAPPGDVSVERMRREARAAAGLHHPNLITVFDFGIDDVGPYLVMELVEGRTLDALAGELGTTQIVDLGAQVADGLAAIHEAGIVHRDVKPANVIMSDHGPLLTDFGIALDPNLTAEITEPGSVVATPSYAAPEVLKGDQPTPASDVYSLAVMIEELIDATGNELDAGLQALLATALGSQPEQRPSASEFAAGLRSRAPTVTMTASSGSTQVLDVSPGVPGSVEQGRGSGWMWAAGLVALFAVGLIAAALALAGDDPSAEASPSTTLPRETSTSTIPSTSTIATESLESRVAGTRDRLESILLEPPREDLKEKDVREIMKNVDEAIATAEGGDLEEAGKKLSETAKKIDEKLEGDSFEEAKTALDELAGLLGVEIDWPDEKGKG